MNTGLSHNDEGDLEEMQHPTRQEIESLKSSWKYDPCWDLEDTEGYEAHKQELIDFSNKCKAEWEQRENDRVKKKADEMGMRPNSATYKYLMNLEYKIELLEKDLERFQEQLDNIRRLK